MSIQCTVLGFELATFKKESPPITNRPGLPPCFGSFQVNSSWFDVILFVALLEWRHYERQQQLSNDDLQKRVEL